MHLFPCGERGQPAAGRQDSDLSAAAAGQVAVVRCIFGLSGQVPTPDLPQLIQRHQLAIRGNVRRPTTGASCPENTAELCSNKF